jgi:general secretion pathway protein C
MTAFALEPAKFWQAHGARAVTAALAVAFVVQLAWLLTNSFGADESSDAPQANASLAVPVANTRAALDLVGLMNAHLFGQAPVSADASNAPATSAALVLAGTIAGDDPAKGFALVGETAATARVYSVGAALPGGVRLHSVYRDRVVIDRGGVLESLLLPRNAMAIASRGAAVTSLGPPATNPAVRNIQQFIESNPNALSEIIRPVPVSLGGKQRGLRVYPGNNSAAFSQLGLRPGDLVTSINGTPLDDENRSMEIFQSLQSLPEARVGVVRNGRPTEVTVNMTQVTQAAQQWVGTEGMSPSSALPPVVESPQN